LSFYNKKQVYKLFLLIAALLIGALSLLYTNTIIDDLAEQERKKAELWAEGMRQMVQMDQTDQDISFIFQVIQNNETVPVIIADEKGNVLWNRNLDSLRSEDTTYLKKEMEEMKRQNEPIVIAISPLHKQYIYYKNSILLTRLFYYPFIQIIIIFAYILVAYLSFSSFRKAEQNQVWIGMAKETAHQLGTPISSLLAWAELIKLQSNDPVMIDEVNKDIGRLEMIANRFSKIGSAPVLVNENITHVVSEAVTYIKNRTSSLVTFEMISGDSDHVHAPLNKDLFAWVVENLCRNAVDAIAGQGKITIHILDFMQYVYIDVNDNGKGIPKGKFKTVFKPGYTTKKRGWGLGLSLSKRIIEEYHKGKIFVKSSDTQNGTTFRIVLNK
jgi:signal transduction histidine kinase